MVTALAIIAHEIPQEVGDYIVLLNAGFSRAKALLYNAVSGLAAVVGDTVNVAARLEGLAKQESGMLAFMNQATRDLLPPPLRECLRPLGERALRGRGTLIPVWGLPEEVELPEPAPHLLRPEEEIL